MRPDASLEKNLNSIGLYTQDGIPLEPNSRSLFVEVAINPETNPEVPDYGIMYVSKRGVRLGFYDFEVDGSGEQKKIRFAIAAYPPKEAPAQDFDRLVGTSFIDLCWNCGNEEVTGDRLTTGTKLRSDAVYGDLGWHLPSRITDRLIDALGLLNATLFDGLLEDAIIYARV